MTSRERITAALEGGDVDRVPWSPFLAYVWENFPPEIQEMGQPEFLRQVGADPLWRGACGAATAVGPDDIEIRTHAEGDLNVAETVTPVGTIREARRGSPEGNTSFLIEHPLKTEEDFKVQMWIEEHTRFEYNDEGVEAPLAAAGAEGLAIAMLIPRGKSAYQSLVEYHVGTEELIYANVDFPETVQALIDVMVANDLEAVKLAAQCEDLTYFLTWEDSGTQNYSPDQYDHFIGSEIGQWCEILAGSGKKYIQHACGHCKALVGRMKAHGVFAVESLSPPPTGDIPLAEARAIAGSDFGIIGGIEPTQFLNLSMEELDPYVRQVLADGAGGPFVLANSDSCPPGVTMDKFKLVGDIVREH